MQTLSVLSIYTAISNLFAYMGQERRDEILDEALISVENTFTWGDTDHALVKAKTFAYVLAQASPPDEFSSDFLWLIAYLRQLNENVLIDLMPPRE